MKSWRVACVAFIVGFFMLATPAQSDVAPGLNLTVYTYSPEALPDRKPYEVCEQAWVSVSQIAHDWGGDVVAGCQGDFVLLHYTGFITLPESGLIAFQSLADDGFWMSIGGETVIDDWYLKGCSGTQGTHEFVAGVSQAIDVWFYEYGGGACNELYYFGSNGFGLVPASAFTVERVPIPEPTPTPTFEPTQIPTPEPSPSETVTTEPSATPEPSVEPSVSESPTSTSTPTESATETPTPTASPEPTQTEQPPVQVEPVPNSTPLEPLALPLPSKPPTPLIIASQTPAKTVQKTVQNSVHISLPNLVAKIPGAQQLAKAAEAFMSIGNDMTPEQRQQAQQVVVSAVVVSQIARRIK